MAAAFRGSTAADPPAGNRAGADGAMTAPAWLSPSVSRSGAAEGPGRDAPGTGLERPTGTCGRREAAGCTEAEATAEPIGALITASGSALPTDGAARPGFATDGAAPETPATRVAEPAPPRRAATDAPSSRPADPDPDGSADLDTEESAGPSSA